MYTEVQLATKFVRTFESATRRSHDFTLTFAQYKKIMSRKTCFYTGVAFAKPVVYTKGDKVPPNAITIDRKDPAIGYVFSNCVASTHLANQTKNLFEHDPEKIAIIPSILKKMETIKNETK